VDKGFGFIKDRRARVFPPERSLRRGLQDLRENDSVEFDVGQGQRTSGGNVRRTSTPDPRNYPICTATCGSRTPTFKTLEESLLEAALSLGIADMLTAVRNRWGRDSGSALIERQ
jgi:cold shock CspA family protein